MLKVIISGGGTGGHIFPAIAIANALKAKYNQVEILFVGALGKMEMEKVPAAGYKIEGLNITGIQRSFSLSNLAFPFKLLQSVNRSRQIIKSFKPDVVVGVGGFASGPLLYAASQLKIPALIQEQNSYPGITNKLLAKRVQTICVAYENMDRFFPKEKLKLTGNPVRNDILNLSGKRERALEYFKLKEGFKTVFVTGGSLGSRTINESILKNIDLFAAHDIQLIWQTGKAFIDKAQAAVKNYSDKGIYAYDFISKMDYAYAMADLVISRAGASSVSELSLVNKAAVLIPYPLAAEDHQTKNAMALVNYNAAVLIKDDEAREKLGDVILDLIKHDDKRLKLEHNITKLAIKDSAEVIAAEVYRLGTERK
ncbi:MAG TPA: undecaprenyldiphospho-muramoylpentapeptide beta-N-acetylglucosaminyltransferase [Bacteroidia bacterium]|nr:undecaprenyldiphospho-muramoylpentapeptide beta-N-acetylglucosaminyltransferase [Bacteroidia bacterium]